MCAVYATDAKAFFEMLSTSCKYKYGRAIDVIHMSNTMFDTARIKEMEIFRVKHILRDIIAHSIKKDYANSTPPVLDVSTDEGVNKLYEITIKSLSNDTVNTIN